MSTTAPAAGLEVVDLGKTYKRRGQKASTSQRVLDNVSLSVEAGEFVTLIGHSGCGKTTLLNCVAGLTDFNDGQIRMHGKPIQGPGPDRAVVFQHASLLPWRTIERNVAYGLELRRQMSSAEIKQRVASAIELVGLSGYASHYPHEVSGGMQQRVNLARALAVEPDLVLMDEPFGALDAMTKESLQDQLMALADREKRTTIFVTHDIHEAVYLADRVVLMTPKPGKISKQVVVPFGRNRTRALTETREFNDLVRELRELLTESEASV
ncbi:ABC transporter ATP-binding protein [Subtercola lobariae]|uniref:ABC transporter ATP-binding protein n=1 Tax=Subtercola lobariae TaxID=1588641 RepID=A0A917EXP0_9MICO|nr:ABC transporter ATP-binding protein [Subtercola lobariae]GGF31779.1 ABC transporter ATP-binding protein [Subtercola lobariae]